MTEYLYKPPATLPAGSDVIAYLRDSGGGGQQDSIEQQAQVITQYCQEHGLNLTKIYADTASGRKTKNREQFLEMYHSIEAMPEDLRPAGLLLWAYSRFSRDIVDFNFYLYGLLKNKIIVHSITEQIPEGIAGQVMLSFTAYRNAGFSIELGKQIKRGIAASVEAGYCNGGQPPRGYIAKVDGEGVRRDGKKRTRIKWEPDPDIAPLVVLAWELRAQGKSYAEITEATKGKIYSIKNSWTSHFRNKSYLGIGKAGGLEIPNHHAALVTQELWDAVRKVEAAMPRYGRQGELLHHRRMKYPSLLSGLSVCIYCGSAMVLHTEKDYRSYACGKRERQCGYKDCQQSRRVNARKADRAILDAVLDRILSPEFVNDLVSDIQNKMTAADDIDREIGKANDLLIATENGITRLVELAERTGANIEEISVRLKKLKQEQAEHITTIKRLKAERDVEVPQITPEALARLFSFWREQIAITYQNGDILKAKKLLYQFVQKIELGYNAAVIHYTYPLNIPAENISFLCAHK